MDLLSGIPPWPVQGAPVRHYPPVARPVRCDVAIIGAGIAGACVAHELARGGVKVAVFDRRQPGAGSSAASTGLVQYELDASLGELALRLGAEAAATCYRLCADAVRRIGRLAAGLARECGHRERPSLWGARTVAQAARLRQEAELRCRHGFPIQYWDRREVRAQSSLPYLAALVSRPAGEIDTFAFTHGLLEGAVAAGTRVYGGTGIRSYQAEGRGVRLETDQGVLIRARRVVIATGYELEPFLDLPGTKLVSTFSIASRPVASFEGWPARCLIWEAGRPYHYLRTTADGRAIIGGADEPHRGPARRDRQLPAKSRRLRREFRRMFPAIPFETEFAWGGTFAVTKDGLPFIGPHPSFPRAWLALVYGGNGIPFAVIAAQLIHDFLRGRRNPAAGLFGLDR